MDVARNAPAFPTLGIDERGFVRSHGVRVLTAQARAGLSPVWQAFALARSELGEVPVLDVGAALSSKEQTEGNFVCPELTRSALREMLVLEKEFDVKAVWTLDGSWRHIADVGMVAASAAARHDGVVVGGRLEENDDSMALNAYLGELGAQVDWAYAEGARRVLVGFNAVSPVLALLRFRSMHDRAHSACYRDDWLASFSAALQLERFDVVIFYHLKAHSGISLNEYADKAAGAAANTDSYRAVPGVGRAGHASASFGAFRGDRLKAELTFGAAVRARLRAESVNTQRALRGEGLQLGRRQPGEAPPRRYGGVRGD
jgi:hypothetical protein